MKHTIPDGAVARMEMVSGNLIGLAEMHPILESYEYVQDRNDQYRWNFQWSNQEDAHAYLRILQDGEIIDLYTDSPENMLNVNFLTMKFGWLECHICAQDDRIKQMMEARLTAISVVSLESGGAALPPIEEEGPEELAGTPPLEPLPQRATPVLHEEEQVPAGDVEGSMREQFAKIQVLTVRLNEMESRAAELEEERDRLVRRVRELETRSENNASQGSVTVASGRPDAGDGPLMTIIERHLLSLLDLTNLHSSQLVKDLQKAGLDVEVKLVRAA